MRSTNKSSQTVEKSCGHCGAKDCDLRCSQCKQKYYCNRNCQVKHWEIHSKECKNIEIHHYIDNNIDKECKQYPNDPIMTKTITAFHSLFSQSKLASIDATNSCASRSSVDTNHDTDDLCSYISEEACTSMNIRLFMFDHLNCKV